MSPFRSTDLSINDVIKTGEHRLPKSGDYFASKSNQIYYCEVDFIASEYDIYRKKNIVEDAAKDTPIEYKYQKFDKDKFELTGEYRYPKKGEFFADSTAYYSNDAAAVHAASHAKYIDFVHINFTNVKCCIVREKGSEKGSEVKTTEPLKLTVGPLYLTAGGYVVQFRRFNSHKDRIVADRKFCPGSTEGGSKCVNNWFWKLDGTILGLSDDWGEKLRIVKQLDFDLPTLPAGYRWKDGYPQLKSLRKGDSFLCYDGKTHTSQVNKAYIDSGLEFQRFIVEPIECEKIEPEKSEFPRYFTHKTGFKDGTTYIEVHKDKSYLVNTNGNKRIDSTWTLDKCVDACRRNWKEIDGPIVQASTNVPIAEEKNMLNKDKIFEYKGKKYKHMNPPVFRKAEHGEIYTPNNNTALVYKWKGKLQCDGHGSSIYSKYILEPVNESISESVTNLCLEKGEPTVSDHYTVNNTNNTNMKNDEIKFPTEAVGNAVKTIGTLLVKKPAVYLTSLAWSMTKKSTNYWLLEPAKNIITRVMMSIRYMTMVAIMGTGIYGGVYTYNNYEGMKKEVKKHIPTIKIQWNDETLEIDS